MAFALPRPHLASGRVSVQAMVIALLCAAPTQGLAQEAHALTGDQAEAALVAHNAARLRLGAPELQWDAALAEIARRCVVENTGRSFRHCDTPHGENMYGTTGVARAADAVQAWMDEEASYDVARARCRDFECGHFSQVVWSSTSRVGCAAGPGESGWVNLICNYDPPGNSGYMSDESGERGSNGSWFYFAPRPFARVGGSEGQPEVASAAPALDPTETGAGVRPPKTAAILWKVPWSFSDGVHRSGDIGDGASTALEATVLGPGTMVFRWKVSSEVGFDVLRFTIDGAAVAGPVSGIEDWSEVTVEIPAGEHRLTWTYAKDQDTAAGEDAAWVDGVRFTRR